MGSIIGKAMDENLKKNQEFMAEMQKNTVARQIQMQNLMRERMMATQLSRAREMLNWWAAFYGFAVVGGIGGFRRTKNPAALVPLLPLTFIVGYQADLAYGNKMDRIRAEAEQILEKEASLLLMPSGVPTLQEIDERRKQ